MGLISNLPLSVIVVGSLFLLWMIVWYLIIAPLRRRNVRKRLRQPDLNGLEALVGFSIPASLKEFYLSWPHLEKVKHYLVDPAIGRHWFIGGFQPLALVDARAMIGATKVPGLPIADDCDKGVYFLNSTGQIELCSPKVLGGRILVASSIEALAQFRVAKDDEIEPDNGGEFHVDDD